MADDYNKDGLVDIDVTPAVLSVIIRMYERYVEVKLNYKMRQGEELMTIQQFANKMLIEGLDRYQHQIEPLEKDCGITQQD